MGNKKQHRECEECGARIDSNNPSTRLCKRCEIKFATKRQRDGSKHRSKGQKKRRDREEEFFEDYENL